MKMITHKMIIHKVIAHVAQFCFIKLTQAVFGAFRVIPTIRESRRTTPYGRRTRSKDYRVSGAQIREGFAKTDNPASLMRRLSRLCLLCLTISLVAVLLGGLVWGYHNKERLFDKVPVGQVIIRAPMENLSQEKLQHLVEPYVDQGFFSVDLAALKNRLEQEPWVSRALISRSWPATIEIKIIERKPIAFWGKSHLMDHQGELFQPKSLADSDLMDALPKLEAPDNYSKWVLQQYHQINHLLRSIDVKIEGLALNSQMSWHLTLDNGISLKVDRQNTLEKLMQLVEAYPRLAQMERPIEQIDLRYMNGFSVKWRNSIDAANS